MGATRISVCIATYNGGTYIVDQLNSILVQLGEWDEIVISDDSSTDDTVRRIMDFGDSRIKLVEKQKFKSPIFNFENALKHASGQYIFLSDQDDVWLPNRVSVAMEFLQDYDLVVNDCVITDENLKSVNPSYFKLVNAKRGIVRNLLKTSSYIGCCMAFKRPLLEKALPFPKNIPMHDFWIAMLAEVFFKIKFVHQPLVLYRRHPSNVSATSSKSKNSIGRKMAIRVNLVTQLVLRILSTRE